MEKVLISSCLLGEKVRYHGGDALCTSPIFKRWKCEDRIVSFCPEVSAGLSVPRAPCEIINGDGKSVLIGMAQVVSHKGENKSKEFIDGAKKALEIAIKFNIKVAVLKKNSPSCGNKTIYDGTYSGMTTNGSGVTASLLMQNNIKVFNESELDAANEYLALLERKGK